MDSFPDYYEILEISDTATIDEIKDAYKRKALETHPDRFAPGASQDSAISPSLSQEEAKMHFQQVADAYYVLSDDLRRAQYDTVRNSRRKKKQSSGLWNAQHTDPNSIFGNVFEDLLRPEIENPKWFYAPIGAVSGAMLGFVCGNVPGLMLGAYLGNKLGSVRDAKGVSVYEAYSRLSGNHKAAILAAIAAKMITGGKI
nr:15539_t:CDS:2 [Entrophospora candida]CAG8628845.1 12233_t:CDS:2 [Entrophospora candida]